MATTAFLLLLLATLVLLGRPPGRLTAAAVPLAALHGVLVLDRLSARRRERLRPVHPRADHAVDAGGTRAGHEVRRATTA